MASTLNRYVSFSARHKQSPPRFVFKEELKREEWKAQLSNLSWVYQYILYEIVREELFLLSLEWPQILGPRLALNALSSMVSRTLFLS